MDEGAARYGAEQAFADWWQRALETGDRSPIDQQQPSSVYAQTLSELKLAQANPDTESAHVDADGILEVFVRTLGFDDVADAYHAVKKWYA